MWKKIWKVSSLKYVAAFLIPAIFAMIMCSNLDNDSWGLLAEGRYIVEHGLYQTDVLSIHEVPIVVSNYAFAVCFWFVYSVFGAVGIYICMLILNFVVCFLLYRIYLLISKRNVNLSLMIMMVTDCLLALMGFVVTRAQMLTFVVMLAEIYLLELYVAKNKVSYLWTIPVLSLIQVNFHASYWWILMVVMVAYIIDSLRCKPLHLQGYRTRSLLVVLLVSILVGLVNPYGIQMMISIFGFYFSGALNSVVSELQAYSPFLNEGTFIAYLVIMSVAFLCLVGNRKYFRMRYFLLFFGFMALALNTVKAFSQLILVMGFPIALMYQKVRIERIIDAKMAREAICFDVGILAVNAFIATLIAVLIFLPQTPSTALVKTVDVIDADVGEVDKSSLKIYTDYNDGGYVEFRGYRAYLDPQR